MSSLGVCWQLQPWWEVGLKLEGPDSEPGVSPGASFVFNGLIKDGVDPRAWSRNLEGVGFLPGVMEVSDLIWGMAGSEDLGLQFCAGFSFSPGVHALVRG